jgi:hypothetical protein
MKAGLPNSSRTKHMPVDQRVQLFKQLFTILSKGHSTAH